MMNNFESPHSKFKLSPIFSILYALIFFINFFLLPTYPPIATEIEECFSYQTIYNQFPFNLTSEIKNNIRIFVESLKSFKESTPINPFTGRSVFIAAVVNLAQYDLAMNFLCSLSQAQVDPKSMLLITIDEESYVTYKRYNFPICYLNLTSCNFEYYVLVKVKIIILKILLKLNYELLVTDIDIVYFEPFKQYLNSPQEYDLGFWYECGTLDVSKKSFPWYVNTGFIRMFPSINTLKLIDEWIYENNQKLKMGNQKPLQDLMQNSSKTKCTYIEKNDDFFLNLTRDPSNIYFYKGYWRCTVLNHINLIWHIFPERKMFSGCEAVTRKNTALLDYRAKNVTAGMLHLICVSGGKDKGRFLNSSGLWFYDTTNRQCIREKPIKRWKKIFTTFNESFFMTPYVPTLYRFPSIHIKADFSKYSMVDDVEKWALSN